MRPTRRAGSNRCGAIPDTTFSCPASYQVRRILPDADPVRRRKVQLLPRPDVERRIPRVHVPHDAGAHLAWRVRIRQQLLASRGLTNVATPHLCPAEIETLICRKTVDH